MNDRPKPHGSKAMAAFLGLLFVYGSALGLMYAYTPRGVHREQVRIDGPDNAPCLGTAWLPENPKAVVVLGHGVSGNQGIMAHLARSYALHGYAAVTIDFWGSGLSRERFNWLANARQLHAWFAWTHERFPDLPMAYLGYSMGGVAGDLALRQGADMDAYVSMGMLPRKDHEVPTLIAAGRFEELFTPERAHLRAGDKMDVLISPYSNHILEASDPVLIQGILSWTEKHLGFDGNPRFPWAAYLSSMAGLVLGCGAALALAGWALKLLRHPPRGAAQPTQVVRRWSVNPYRIVGRLLGCGGRAAPMVSTASLPMVALQGFVYSVLFIVMLHPVLSTNIYTYALLHPERWLIWLLLFPLLAPVVMFDGWVLERLPLTSAWKRFMIASATRAIPLIALAIGLRFVPGMAFFGMILGIWAFVFVMLSAAQSLAVRGARDYRAGLVASAILFVWVIAFWSPLYLG